MNHALAKLATLPGICLLSLLFAPSIQAAEEAAASEFFEKKVRPILVEHCYQCHAATAKKVKGGLLLDSRAGMLKGGDNGPAVVPGKPEASRLIEAIGYKNVDLQMPPRARLPEAAIADLTAWVKQGAPWPAEKTAAGAAPQSGFDLHQRKRDHWSWQPVRPQPTPGVKLSTWPRVPADHFILAKLEEQGLAPAPPADPHTLLRRLYFDLVGLPPTPAEQDAFLRDPTPEALVKVVDHLLASPQFGERWGRHWLDLMRYAETRGHEFDYPAPNAYQYRDYVIRALNADVPYNQLVLEHLAGDLLPSPRFHPKDGFNESILGTGFWCLGEEVHSPVDIRQDESDRFDNKIDVMTKAFLGLTVSCARCHDHKFDAISTKDYYALFGFLQSSSYRQVRFDSLDHNRVIAQELEKLRKQSRPVILRAYAESMKPALERLGDHLLAAKESYQVDSAGISRIAAERKLDEKTLAAWIAHLRAAEKDANDPFHLWARIAADPQAGDPQKLHAIVAPLLAGWRKQQADADAALKGFDILVDYERTTPADWLPDDVTFGTGPLRPGAVRYRPDARRPIERIVPYAAAENDPAWNGLKITPGTENDPGALGALVRAGRTLRTPTFPLTTGKLYYLVKGSGRIYAAVDSHAVINGPLHGQLVQQLKGSDGFQWLGHDLSAYRGHRAHVEFTPADGAELSVAMIVQGPATPGPVTRPNELLQRLAGKPLAGAADAYQQLFLETAALLQRDEIRDPDHARLANWLVQHEALSGLASDDAGRRIAGAAQPFLEAQSQLLARIRTESRLALALMDGSSEDEHVFIRGSHKAPGERVARRFLEALAGPQPIAVTRGSGRLELARQITDPELNPFISRVIVNRVWHHLFGRGIVGSVDNFGVLGEKPTHPELLDHLADRFVRQGWSLKKLVRELVLSQAYQMSSQTREAAEKVDPQNLLLHRMRVRRLEGEAIRDAMLAVSGRLDGRMYGRSVLVHLTPFMEGRGRPASGPIDGDGRRSIYLAVRRNFLMPMLLAFDTPIPFSTVGKRTVSNVPAQALILLNDPFVHLQAEHWGKRLQQMPGPTEERIRHMYRSAFARPATAEEVAACLDFLGRQNGAPGEKRDAAAESAAWIDLAHALFNLKEFIYIN